MLAPYWSIFRLILEFRRTAIVPTRLSSIKRKRQRITNVSRSDVGFKRVDNHNPRALEFKVRQLQEFTRGLKEKLKLASGTSKKLEVQKELGKVKLEEGDDNLAGELFHSLDQSNRSSQRQNLSTLILSGESLQLQELISDEIRQRINNDDFLLTQLSDRDNQNWDAVISKLFMTEKRLLGIHTSIISSGLLKKIKNLSYENIEKLDKMLLEVQNGDITHFTLTMYETLLYNLSNLKADSEDEKDRVIIKMKQMLDRYDRSRELSVNSGFELSQFCLNCCLKYSTKLTSFENMEYFLSKFKNDYGITPNRVNYTTVLQFYTKAGLSKQAWNVFDTMKFLSGSHTPDIITYNSVLHLCNKDRDYSKAIDLYQEMIDRNLQPSIDTLNIMAKTMARASADNVISEGKADSLRLLGWKYIHTLETSLRHARRETYLYHTLEAMMALAAYDGDVGLARALYYKYTTRKYKETVRYWRGEIDFKKIWKITLDPQLFNFLLLAYSNFHPNRLPILLGYENGIKLRKNILNSVDYVGRCDLDDDIKVRLPMLPIADINRSWQILAESRALWEFNLEFGGYYNLKDIPEGFGALRLQDIISKSNPSPHELKFNLLRQISEWKIQFVNCSILNSKSLTTFLTIPIKNGDKLEFMLRLREFTFQQQELEGRVENLQKLSKLVGSLIEPNDLARESKIYEIDIDENIKWLGSMKHKVVAENYIYELMIKAASAFKDLELAKEAWQNRGEYRKTRLFQQMDPEKRIESDTQFAVLMVQFFTNQEMFTDALAIVLSTKKYIDWQYYMVKGLHRGLIELEDQKSISILMDIVNKRSSIDLLEEEIHDFQL